MAKDFVNTLYTLERYDVKIGDKKCLMRMNSLKITVSITDSKIFLVNTIIYYLFNCFPENDSFFIVKYLTGKILLFFSFR